MDVSVRFLGAAKTVTGSKYLLDIGGYRLLVDCGLFQGPKKLRERNWSDLPQNPEDIDGVIITHSHIDHIGFLPRIFRQGYNGPVYCTDVTSELMEIMLQDSAKIQEEEAAYARKKGSSRHKDPQPLYRVDHVKAMFSNMMPQPSNTWISFETWGRHQVFKRWSYFGVFHCRTENQRKFPDQDYCVFGRPWKVRPTGPS